MRGRVAAGVAALLAMTACAHAPEAASPSPAQTKPATATPSPVACHRPTLRTTRGRRPAITQRYLRTFPNDQFACVGLWVPRLDEGFVPQGLALDGNTAWISGHAWDRELHHQSCQVMQIDLRSGKLLKFAPRVKGSVGKLRPVVCRHGGALALTKEGLWLIETARIWLLDPRRVGRADQIKRAWRVIKPAKGSVGAIDGDHLVLGGFTSVAKARIDWFSMAELLARGRVELRPKERRIEGSRYVTALKSQPAPTKLQGLQFDPDGELVIVRSSPKCGEMRVGSAKWAFLPGAEGVAFDRNGQLWALSETTALRPTIPLVPSLVRFDAALTTQGAGPQCLP